MNRPIIAALLSAATAVTAEAQVASTATPLAPVFAADCAARPVLDTLTLRYNQGNWTAFQREARALLDALRSAGAPTSVRGTPATPTAACTAPCSSPAGRPIRVGLHHAPRRAQLDRR